MTANRRILVNIIATYGRSLYALLCGLFTARWVLVTLGEVDYGLIGVVGGLVGFVSFINGLLAGSVSRFYAFAVGEMQTAKDCQGALDECTRWFNVAFILHTGIPVVLIVIGYPIGEWAVRNYLTIPLDRVESCVWVFRITCLSCFVGMVSVPYNALYNAHQEIAELTIYSFVTTTVNVLFLCYMVSHRGDWLLPYAAWSGFLAIMPSLVMSARAFLKYEECRIVPRYFFDFPRYKKLAVYVGSQFVNALVFMLNSNGIAILVNKCLGPTMNATMTIGGTVSQHCQTLAQSITGAFSPAITNAAGAGNLERMRTLAFATCRVSTIGILVFALPLILEVKEVMRIWLKTPPESVGALCVCFLATAVAEKLAEGHWMSIFALGKVVKFNLVEAIIWFSVLPLAYLLIKCGLGILGVGISFVIARVLAIFVKLYFGHKIAGLSARHWLYKVFLPIAVTVVASLFSGCIIVHLLAPSFVRVVLTTTAVEIVFCPLVWLLVIGKMEKSMILERVARVFAGSGR